MDTHLMNEVLELARTGLKTANAAFGTAVRFKELFQSSQSTADDQIKGLMADLMLEIVDTKLANAELKIKLTQMLDAMNAAQDNKAKLENYALHKTRANGFVYVPKDLPPTDERFHMICSNCYENGVRSILQGGGYDVERPRCRAQIPNTPVSYSF